MTTQAIKTCLSINCPERKSVCCGARCTKIVGAVDGDRYVCSACGKDFINGKCTAGEDKSFFDYSLKEKKKIVDNAGKEDTKMMQETIAKGTPKMYCPKCDAEYDDYDGFGVLYCPKCGYCTHASITGNVCGLCKKKISPPPAKGEEWEKKFDKEYYPGYFCDVNECDMTAIHIPIIQDDTAGKRVVGEILEEKQCQCSGEIKRQELKSFIRSLLSQAYEEGRREAVEEVEKILRDHLSGKKTDNLDMYNTIGEIQKDINALKGKEKI